MMIQKNFVGPANGTPNLKASAVTAKVKTVLTLQIPKVIAKGGKEKNDGYKTRR